MMGKFARALLATAGLCVGLTGCGGGGGGDSGGGGNGGLPVTVNLNTSKTSVSTNENFNLTWSTANAETCTAAGDPSFSGTKPPQGPAGGVVVSLSTQGTYNFTLTCTGSGGKTGSDSVSVTVTQASAPPPAPTVDLVVNPTSIPVGGSAVLTWSSTNATSCTAPNSNPDSFRGLKPTQSPSGGANTGVQNGVGSIVYTLSCSGPGGTATDDVALTVTSGGGGNPGGGATTVDFNITPSSITVGSAATLTWSSTNADTCTATGPAGSSFTGSVGTSGSMSSGTQNSAGTLNYALSCTKTGGTPVVVNRALTVTTSSTPPATVAVDVSVVPGTIRQGQSAVITWSSSNATSCTASGDWAGSKPLAGGQSTGTLNTLGSRSYVLTCTGPNGSASDTGTLTVTNSLAPVINLTAVQTTVPEGTSTNLNWTTQNAVSCTAFGDWSGSENTSGTNVQVGPFTVPGTYNYALQCNNGPGLTSSASVAIEVTPNPSGTANLKPIFDFFTADPTLAITGQTSALSWQVRARATAGGALSEANIVSCTASGGQSDFSGLKAAHGTANVSLPTAGIYNYVLECASAGGSARKGVIVLANDAPPAVDLRVNGGENAFIMPGAPALLQWTAVNATSCTATADPASATWQGSKSTNGGAGEGAGDLALGPGGANKVYFFSLTCTNAAGDSATDTVSVTVSTAPAVPTVDLKVNGLDAATVQVNTSASLTWTSSGTTGTGTPCTATDGWTGAKPANSTSPTTIGPFATAGTYTFGLTCTGPNSTSSSDVVTVTVLDVPLVSCNVGNAGGQVPSLDGQAYPNMKALLSSSGASFSSSIDLLCIGCDVDNKAASVDDNDLVNNFTTISVPVGLLGGAASVTITGGTTYPSTQDAGVIVAIPGADLLTLSLLGGLEVEVLSDNNIVRGRSVAPNFLDLDLLATLHGGNRFFIPVKAITGTFQKVRFTRSAVAAVLAETNFYAACVEQP